MYYNTLIILTSFFASLGISYMMIPSLIKIISQKRLLDANDARKIHTEQVGAFGGIAVFAACWITTLLLIDLTQIANIKYIFVATFLLFLVGLKDDLVNMSAIKRLILQVVVAIMAFFAGFQLEGFYGLFEIYETNQFINIGTTIFFIVLMINAYNCIDGINGLAGGLGMLSSVVFGLMFWYIGSINMAIMSFALAGALFGFLHFNFGKAKIFMGDNGSTVLGFILAIFAIQYMNIQPNLAETTALPAIVFSIIFIPIVDFLKVIITRMMRGKSPFHPDRTHIHHHFLSLGLSHSSICYILYSINLTMIVTIMFFAPQNGWGNILPISLTAISAYLVVKITHLVMARKHTANLK